MEPLGSETVVKVTGSTIVIVDVEVTPAFAFAIASKVTEIPVVRPDGAV